MGKAAAVTNEGGGRQKSSYLVRCLQKGCAAKAGPLDDAERTRMMAIEHAISFKHVVEIHRSKVFRTIDPASLPRLG